jgi:hypothetical protein
MIIARQRLGKHIPAKRTRATEGRPLLGNGSVNAFLTVEAGTHDPGFRGSENSAYLRRLGYRHQLRLL